MKSATALLYVRLVFGLKFASQMLGSDVCAIVSKRRSTGATSVDAGRIILGF